MQVIIIMDYGPHLSKYEKMAYVDMINMIELYKKTMNFTFYLMYSMVLC